MTLRLVRYHPRVAAGDGGMSSAIRAWSAAQALAGADVTLVFEDGEPPSVAGPVSWVRLEHRRSLYGRVPIGLERVIAGKDLLVLHGGWNAHNLRAGAAARSAGVAYVLEPRGAYDPNILRRRPLAKRAWWWIGERRLVAGAAAMHAFFADQVEDVRAVGYRGPVVVSPNGMDAPPEGSIVRRPAGYLLWLGRFDPEHKGLDLLVQAVAGLQPADRPMLQLRGPDFRGGKAVIEALVRDLGVERWITVGPAVYGEPKRTLLLGADGFVYPSRWEACGNSVLEAVSLGLPTLCTIYPLGRHLAERGGAFMSEPTADALGTALLQLQDRSRAEQVGRTGASIVRDDFSWPRVAASWLAQVSNALGLPAVKATAKPIGS